MTGMWDTMLGVSFGRILLAVAVVAVVLTVLGFIYAEAFGPGGNAHPVGHYKVLTP